MNGLLLTLSLTLVIAQMTLPRRWAFVPLLIAACHAPYNVSLGGDFTALRLVLLVGLMRAGFTGLVNWDTRKPLDVLMAAWSVVALISAVGHEAGNPFIYRAGLVFNVLGTYLYARAYIRSPGDFRALIQSLSIILLPLAALLVFEAATGTNGYHGLGARFFSLTREERNRAMGPFGTPILAGTLGAVCFPLFVAIWRSNRTHAKLGMGACLTIIVTSASSGPIGTFLIGTGALFLWKWRTSLNQVKLAVVALVVLIQLFRERSIWYLISLIDFVGGSTGWYRSRLLDSAAGHFGEWWLWGTDYTRHWMPTGLRTNPNHSDLTSYYVHLGVIGGLPLLAVLVLLLWRGFRMLGTRMRKLRALHSAEEFPVWCIGSTLFAHTITFFTVSYFDQLYVFFYVLLGAITVFAAAPLPARPKPKTETADAEVLQPAEPCAS